MRWNDLIGRQLGQYTILEEIGRGGSSRVYRGHDAETERDVAIKIIPNDAEDRVGFVHRFEREVQAVAQLNHPNIVTVFDRGETDDLVYLIMQCVMGGTLRTRLGTPLPTHEATSYIVQMAQALHHAHQKGIVHRDVKPSNMLIDAENPRHLLLTDFGIAKLQGARGLTKTGTTIGTPEYMAPEQAEGKETDARADVYSLGCVLYEALAGRPPFIGSSPVSVLYQQVHSRPAYIRGFNPDVPRDLTRILEMTLSKRPEDRYGTADLLAQALEPFAEERTSGAPGASFFGPMASGSPMPDSPGPGAEPAPHWLAPAQAVGMSIPSLSETAGPVSPVPAEWRGLGAEGLDALFPEDPEAGSAEQGVRGTGAGAGSGAGAVVRDAADSPARDDSVPPVEGGRANYTIPLPAFRLPARRTRPLDLPLTSSGELDMERLMTQVDSPVLGGRPRPAQGDWGRPRMEDWEPEAGAPPLPQEQHSLREALLHTEEYRAVRPVWRPAPEELASQKIRAVRRSRSRPRPRPRSRLVRPLWAVIGVAAVLLLSAATWVGVSTSALGLTLPGHHASAKATSTATPTVAPTPTATPTPSATATAGPNLQQLLDKQAAAAFRAVTLAPFVDGSCSSGNNTTHFVNGQSVYINLCIADNAPSTLMTIVIRQRGTELVPMAQNRPIGPGGGSLYFYHYGLGPGTYDMLVTLQLNGRTATARDITFTVA